MAIAQQSEIHDGSNAVGDELRPGSRLRQVQYTIERYLNDGGFGITSLARDSLQRRVFTKRCFQSSICRRSNSVVYVRSNA